MAFGKDPSQLKAVGSMRQKTARFDNQRRENRASSGGGGGKHFGYRFQPSVEDIDVVRLVLANYPNMLSNGDKNDPVAEAIELPYFFTEEHFDGTTKKSCFCSAGPFAENRNKAEPCRGCEIFWEGIKAAGGDKEKRKRNRMSKRGLYNYTVVHQRAYHKTAQVDGQGNVRTNESTGEAYVNWTPCTGRGCEACRMGAETKQGATRYWPLGSGHHAALTDADKLIGRDCAGCGNQDCIESLAWTCGNPACGDCVIDMSSTNMSDKDIEKLVEREHRCRTCGVEAFMVEVFSCRACTPRGGTAVRATLFDVDLKVHRVADPNGGNQTSLQIAGWSAPRAIDPMYAELYKPLDLPKLLAPTPYATQEALFGPSQSTRQPVTAATASRAYGAAQPTQTQAPAYVPPNPYAPPQQALPNPYAQQPATPALPSPYAAAPAALPVPGNWGQRQ